MKILHFADLHLGEEKYGRVEPKSGLNTRLLDFLRSLDQIVNYALEEKVDLVIFAGDAYKSRDPNPTYQREFAKRIKKIAASSIPVVLVTGNHDIPSFIGRADTLEIFPTLKVPNVFVFSKPEVRKIRNLQILALPWLPKAHLLSEKERTKSIEETRKLLSKKLSQIFRELLKKIKKDKLAIAVLHQSISSGLFSSGQEVYVGNDPLIPLSEIASEKLSYVALGHLHKFQILNEKPPVIYSGSLERIDFGEEKEEKGFILIEINKETTYKFIPLEARKFKTIEIQIKESEGNPTEYVISEIQKNKIQDAIVKIQIKGKENQIERIYEPDLKEVTKEAFNVVSILKEKEEKAKVKLEIPSKELTPMVWFKKYLESRKIAKKQAQVLKQEAEKLIEEISSET